MMPPMSIAARTKMSGKMLGRMWLNMIRRSRAPIVFAATTNSRSRSENVWPRQYSEIPVQNSAPMTIVSVTGPGSQIAAMMSSRNKVGIDWRVVTNHVYRSSTRPRK